MGPQMNVESRQQREEEEEEEEEDQKERERKGDEGVSRWKRRKMDLVFAPAQHSLSQIRSSKESPCREHVVIEPRNEPAEEAASHRHTRAHALIQVFSDKRCQDGLKLNLGINHHGFDSFTALPGAAFGTAARWRKVAGGKYNCGRNPPINHLPIISHLHRQ